MTPVAHRLLKDLTEDCLAVKGYPKLKAPLLATLQHAQYFEVTGILPLARSLVDALALRPFREIKEALSGALSLPAPITWVECRQQLRGTLESVFILEQEQLMDRTDVYTPTFRIGFFSDTGEFLFSDSEQLAIADGDISSFVEFYRFDELRGIYLNAHPEAAAFQGNELNDRLGITFERFRRAYYAHSKVLMLAVLAVMNDQDIAHVERKPSHKGLMRQVRKVCGSDAGFNEGWRQYTLHVSERVSGDGGGGGAITGTKALHFCRQFVRLRRGKIEFVRGHWRGDAAKGVVNKVYRVVP